MGVLACRSEAGDPVLDAPSEPRDEIEYRLHPWVNELSAAALESLVERDDATGSLRFDDAPSAVRRLEPGQVVVAGKSAATPRGLLRLVVSVDESDEYVDVATRPVPLQLAFESLHAVLRRESVDVATPTGDVARSADPGLQPLSVFGSSEVVGGKRLFEAVPFNLDGDLATKDDQLVVRADIEGQVGYHATLDLDWLGDANLLSQAQECLEELVDNPLSVFDDCVPMPDVTFSFEASLGGRGMLEVEGASANDYESSTIYLNEEPWQLPQLVAGPIVLTPELDFTALVAGDAASYFHARTEFGFELSVEAAAGVKSGIESPSTSFQELVMQPDVKVSSSGRSKVTFGPRLSLLAYDTFGFYADLHAFGALVADQSKEPCWDYEVGMELSPGVRLRIPWGLFGLEELGRQLGLSGDVASGKFGSIMLYSEHPFEQLPDSERACQRPPESVLPLGDGPTSETYETPTFTPWSRRLGNVSAVQPYVAQSGQSRVLIEKGHDSSWIVSGAYLGAVLKLADDGSWLWAHELGLGLLPDEDAMALSDRTLSLLALPSRDLGIITAADRLTISSLDHDGNVRWARRLRGPAGLPEGLWQLSPIAMAALPNGDTGVLYSQRTVADDGGVLLLRVSARGALVFARHFRFPTGEVSIGAALVAVDDDLVVAGFSFEPSETRSYLLRFDGSGDVGWARELEVCGATRVRIESMVRRASSDLAVVGTHDLGPERAFFATLSAQGEARNAEAYWTDSILEDIAPVALAELPTSGFVTLATFTPNDLGNTLEFGTHDSLGVRTGGIGYGLRHENGVDRANLRPAGLRLTTDGGVLVVAHVALDNVFDDHGLWISKLPARSYEHSFDTTFVDDGKSTFVNQSCDVATTSVNVEIDAVELDDLDVSDLVETHPLEVTSEPR
jgi:hypothetical protein